MTKPSDAALKAAQGIRAMYGLTDERGEFVLAARIDAAADEKYAELVAALKDLSKRSWPDQACSKSCKHPECHARRYCANALDFELAKFEHGKGRPL